MGKKTKTIEEKPLVKPAHLTPEEKRKKHLKGVDEYTKYRMSHEKEFNENIKAAREKFLKYRAERKKVKIDGK